MTFHPDWAPNLHPLVVHFPIALLLTALVVDVLALLFPRATWAETTAAFLYPAGSISALAAYLTGRQAAAIVRVPGMVHPILLDHWNLALATTVWCLTIAFVRLALAVAWKEPRPRWIRTLLTVAALLGITLLVYTADLGGRLVFEHGVGVRAPVP